MYMNRTSENGNLATPYLDNTGLNTTNVQMTSAKRQTLGLSSFGGTDALITFNSNFIWDFDNTNGITPERKTLSEWPS